MSQRRLILAIENAQLRGRLEPALTASGFIFESHSAASLRADDLRDNLVLLDTNDNARELEAQVEAWLKSGLSPRPLIIGFLSERAVAENPRLTAWTIDGSSALVVLLTYEDPYLERSIAELLRRLIVVPSA